MSLSKADQSRSSARVVSQFDDLIAMGQRAGHLSLPKCNIKSFHKGSLLSGYKGRGMELADIRHYQDGDDVRDINWPMYARTGEFYTKLYQEERERPLYLWVDHGSSMHFATQGCYKAVVASQLAAVVGWHELGNHNRIGGFVVTDRHQEYVKATKSRKGFMRLLQQLCQQPELVRERETSSLASKMSCLNSIKQPGSALYLFSDFRGWDKSCEQQLIQLSQHQDVLLSVILDPLEVNLPKSGTYCFSDGERQTSIDMAKSKSVQAYYRSTEQRLSSIAALASYRNIDCSFIFTNDDPLEASYQKLNQWPLHTQLGDHHEL